MCGESDPPPLRAVPAGHREVCRYRGESTYLIAVNNTPEPQSTAFILPRKTESASESGLGEALTLEDGQRLRLDFPPLGVRPCRIGGL